MNQFIRYCTPKQTKKAIELGAPIDNFLGYDTDTTDYIEQIGDDWYAVIPTVDQMCTWLRRVHNIRIESYTVAAIPMYHIVFPDGTTKDDSLFKHDMTYSEIYDANTLAAIDDALEYLRP